MHVHAALIKLWADGAEIQRRLKALGDGWSWNDAPKENPGWDDPAFEFRLKPVPVIRYVSVLRSGGISGAQPTASKARLAVHPDIRAGLLRITLDAEKKTLLSAEVVH